MNKKKIKPEYDAVVVGAGIGGLLAAGFLSKKGYSTCVLEGLSFYGGKFTGFDYKGFQVPSGAFHMAPGGDQGGLGRCFTALGLNMEYRYPDAPLVVLEGEKRYFVHKSSAKIFSKHSYFWQFNWAERISLAIIVYYLLKQDIELPDISFADFLKLVSSSKRVMKVIDQCMIFANGTYSASASLIEFKESIKAANYNKEGLIVGGCRHLIESLTDCIKSNGGELFNKVPVAKIQINGKKAVGVTLADGQKIKAGLVVTNAGPKRTRELLGAHTPKWFIEKKKAFLPALGIGYSVASDKPLLDHDGVEVPMDYDHICGYSQISNLDPSLAPPGKHYLLAALLVRDPTMKIADAVNGGINDLLKIFPQITKDNIFNISTFHKDWAAAPTGQFLGQVGANRYPLKVDPFKNLYMLSHDSQGWGFAGDIIGHAAWNFQKMI